MMEEEAIEAAIPEEFKHVKEIILNPDENNRIAVYYLNKLTNNR